MNDRSSSPSRPSSATGNSSEASGSTASAAGGPHSPVSASSVRSRTATPAEWLEGARPRTWPNAFAPVIAGTGAAASAGGVRPGFAVLAAVVALALVVGVNYANDYSDGIRGTDNERVGPLRLTGAGLAAPAAVKRAAFVSFGVAGVAGITLSVASGFWWFIAVGLLCVVAAWFYTGGSRPYGYRGWGEVAVFVFFGLVAVLGTQATQAGRIDWAGLALAVGVGCLSSAVNLVNNLRDIETDPPAGKITLAVRFGDRRSRLAHVLLVLVVPGVLSLALGLRTPWALLSLLALGLSWWATGPVRRGATGPQLIPTLQHTGFAMLAWSLLSALALGFAA